MTPPREPSDQALAVRKHKDAGLVLPVLGFLALTPPAAGIFAIEGSILGVPVVVAYVFSVWLGLILCARHLARRLPIEERQERDG